MNFEGRLAWFAIVALLVTGLVFAYCGHAHAAAALAERIALLVPRLGARGAELVEPSEFGRAVAIACEQDRECAARLVTMAVMESGLRASVARSEYGYREGDAYTDRKGVRQHRAWGTYQQHRSRNNAEVWGSPDYLVQARAARALQLGALAECRAFRSVQAEIGMWRILSGRGCRLPYSGESARMEMLARVRRALGGGK